MEDYARTPEDWSTALDRSKGILYPSWRMTRPYTEDNSMTDLQQKVVLITGASSGIGEATALHLARCGAKAVLGARRTERLAAVVSQIRSQGGHASYRALDVARLEDMQNFVTFAQQEYGRLDVIVNNAGIMPLSPLEHLKVDEWNLMIDVNIRGVLHGIAAGLPIMTEQGHGQFINIASVGAHSVAPTASVYCATKYAVWALSEGLRQESNCVRVTTICPGVVTSELADNISDADVREQIQQMRKVALPADAIARAVAYAVSQPHDVDVNEIIVRPTELTPF